MIKQSVRFLFGFAFFLTMLLSTQAYSQEVKLLKQAHEAQVKRKTVKWVVSDQYMDSQQTSYRFDSDNQFAVINLREMASAEAAAERVNFEPSLYAVAPKRTRLTEIGDEAWLYKGCSFGLMYPQAA